MHNAQWAKNPVRGGQGLGRGVNPCLRHIPPFNSPVGATGWTDAVHLTPLTGLYWFLCHCVQGFTPLPKPLSPLTGLAAVARIASIVHFTFCVLRVLRVLRNLRVLRVLRVLRNLRPLQFSSVKLCNLKSVILCNLKSVILCNLKSVKLCNVSKNPVRGGQGLGRGDKPLFTTHSTIQ